MLKRKLTQADIILIITNLIPVYGAFVLGWNAVEVFIVYALETVIVGTMTVLKLLVATAYKKKDDWHNQGSVTPVSGFFFIFFFIAHYGLFALVQSSIFAEAAGIIPQGKMPTYFFFHFTQYINRDIGFMLSAFVVSYLATSFLPFIINAEYKTVSMMNLMFQPYGRIFIQQLTVILGSMFLTFGWGKGFILVFALVKISFEVFIRFNGVIAKALKEMEKKSVEK